MDQGSKMNRKGLLIEILEVCPHHPQSSPVLVLVQLIFQGPRACADLGVSGCVRGALCKMSGTGGLLPRQESFP